MGDASKIPRYEDLDDGSFSGSSESEKEVPPREKSLILHGINIGVPYAIIDNTDTIEPAKIILDRIARILEGSETCSAVTILPTDGSSYEFFITTNTFSQGSKGNSKGVVLISEIMEFFNELSKKGDDFLRMREDILKQIFLKICIRKMEGEIKEGIHIADGADGEAVVKSIVENILGNPQIMKTPADELGRKYNSTGSRRKPRDVLAAYAILAKLYGSFNEIIEYIKRNRTRYKNPEINALTNPNSMQPLFIDDAMVHAEMKLLGAILVKIANNEKLPEEIYIGISKLCCRYCHLMIDMANMIFKENGINIVIKTRGTHGLPFGNWSLPYIISTDISFAEDSREIELRKHPVLHSMIEAGSAIELLVRQEAMKKKERTEQKQEYTRMSPRSSDGETERDDVGAYQTVLTKTLDILQSPELRINPLRSVAYNIRMNKLGKKLCSSSTFKDLLLLDDISAMNRQAIFFSICGECSKYKPPKILEFLKDQYLCPEKVVRFFHDFVISAPQKEQVGALTALRRIKHTRHKKTHPKIEFTETQPQIEAATSSRAKLTPRQ